jgi:hypothetical protein
MQVAVLAGAAPSGLGLLTSTRPIDRLRYQAKLVFEQMDKDGDGESVTHAEALPQDR